MSDLRERLKQKCQRRYKTIKIQGEEIGIRTLTVAEAEDYFRSLDGTRIVVLAAVDPETKEPLFTEDDEDLLLEMEAGFGSRLKLEIQRFNGFLSEEEEEEEGK